MVDAGRRSTPNLIDPPPARVPVRQRGADSRIGIAQAFGSPRGDAAGGVCPWPDQRTDTMPTNKDFKRLVRARMRKTGEAYTAARAQLLSKRHAPAPAPTPTPLATAADYATLAGRSDAALKANTGCTWER